MTEVTSSGVYLAHSAASVLNYESGGAKERFDEFCDRGCSATGVAQRPWWLGDLTHSARLPVVVGIHSGALAGFQARDCCHVGVVQLETEHVGVLSDAPDRH